MATRSAIGLEAPDGTVVGIYSHWDGYPEVVGKVLDEHYRDAAKVAALVELGDVSSLGAEIGERHPFNEERDGWTKFYGRDRGEPNTAPRLFSSREEFRRGLSAAGAEFSYVFAGGDWEVAKGRGPWKRLADVLAGESLAPAPDGGPPDIVVERDSPLASVVLLRGVTAAGAQWLEDHVDGEAPVFAGRIGCETRYALAIVEGARRDGLTVAAGDEA